MKINELKKSSIKIIQELYFDLIITSTGFENRGSYLIESFNFNSKKNISLGFKENKVLSKEHNDEIFKNNSFDIIEVDDNSHEGILKIIDENISCIKKKNINILVDISTMSSLMYASILKYFNKCNEYDEVNIYFSYTQAIFSKPTSKKSLKFNNPINILNNIESTDKKIALIIGLGYDKDKALGLYEYFQSDLNDMFLFITSNNEYSEDVKSNNDELIKAIDENNIIYYDIENIPYLTSNLNSLVNFLSNMNYRIAIVPTGPKVFSLVSLIVSMYNSNVSVYRSSSGESSEISDKFPDKNKEVIITQVNFVNA
jgi:hypothetical protein